MSLLTLRPTGVEYVHWTVTGLPDPPAVAVDASIDGGTSWHEAIVNGTDVSLLVAGPTAVTPDPAAVVVTAGTGSRELLLRVTDTPEVIIRAAGYLTIR